MVYERSTESWPLSDLQSSRSYLRLLLVNDMSQPKYVVLLLLISVAIMQVFSCKRSYDLPKNSIHLSCSSKVMIDEMSSIIKLTPNSKHLLL